MILAIFLLVWYTVFMKNAIILLATGFEEVEAVTPLDFLRRAGVNVELVSITNEKEVVSSHKVQLKADITLESYCKQGVIPDAIICPGGMPGAINIANSVASISLINAVNNKGGIVAAICASPVVVLTKTDILIDKLYTCYPKMELDYAKEYSANCTGNITEISGNLLTARGPGASMAFAMKLIELLCGIEVALRIKTATCQD